MYYFGFGNGDLEEWPQIEALTPEGAARAVVKEYLETTGNYKDVKDRPMRVEIFTEKGGTPVVYDVLVTVSACFDARRVVQL